MKTLKSQLENITFDNYFSSFSNQECEILDRKFAQNGSGAEFILVDFSKDGQQVVVIEGSDCVEIEKCYVKTIFNK